MHHDPLDIFAMQPDLFHSLQKLWSNYTNQPVQSQKWASGLKFWLEEEERLCCVSKTKALAVVSHMPIVGFLERRLH